MIKRALLPFAFLAALTASPLAMAAQEMNATITRDESGAFSCASRKRVAVLVQAEKDVLPEARYQYSPGGSLHVLCADFSGTAPAPGKKVRIAFRGDAVQVVQ